MKDWVPLAGVVVAQVVILLLFWARQRTDDRRRWHEHRLTNYAQFLSEVEAYVGYILASTKGATQPRVTRVYEAFQGDSRREELVQRLRMAAMTCELLASSAVVREVRNVMDAISHLEAKLVVETFLLAQEEIQLAIEELMRQIRIELHVPQASGASRTRALWSHVSPPPPSR